MKGVILKCPILLQICSVLSLCLFSVVLCSPYRLWYVLTICLVDGTCLTHEYHFATRNRIDCKQSFPSICFVGECQTTFLSNTTCYNKYSIFDEEDDDYCVGWKDGPCDRGEAVYSLASSAWKFVSPLKVWGLPTTGIHLTYGGGGYVAEMAINYNISKLILNDLYRYMWIDRSTRAVFTKFTLYNVGANVLYTSVYCVSSPL